MPWPPARSGSRRGRIWAAACARRPLSARSSASGRRRAGSPADRSGYTLLFAISTYEFEKATTAIILLILLITAIDQFYLFLRKKII